jgi:hypothetical protein
MRLRAIEAAVRVADGFGLRLQEPVLLRSTNNIVAWLRPAPIVAKVGLGRQPGFRREMSVARELSALGAPVVPPSLELPAIVHSRDGFEITFWLYCPQSSNVDLPGAQIAAALKRLHAAYATISRELRADLPSYMSELESVSELLRDIVRLSALPEADRHLLRHAFDRLLARMQLLSPAETHIVIHGSPHPYNILTVDGELRFIDFETTCIGPLEWDLAHTAPDAELCYAGAANPTLLRACRDMVSVKTAAWCWADVDRGDLRYHAEVHLARVKEILAEYE